MFNTLEHSKTKPIRLNEMIRIALISFVILMAAMAALAQQSLKPGNCAPDFDAETLDGKVYNLSELQGKVVVLTFWSTRCDICHSEIPKLNEVAKRYQDKGVVFLALTMENPGRIEPYLRKNPFVFNIVPNSFGVVLKYADMDKNGAINMGFPSYFLISKNGTIALKSYGWDKTAKLETQISQLLSTE